MNKWPKSDKLAAGDALENFMAAMWHRLTLNSDKGISWRWETQEKLLERLREETNELAEAFPPANTTISELNDIMNEAADVANFAMFIFDNALHERDRQVEECGDKA